MTNNSLRMLSDSLAEYGIASLRYDKRGIGQSKDAADESRLLFTDYVADVSEWIRMLRKDRRFGKIFVAGHSEGSLIGMLAVKKTPVAGYISIAGAAVPADVIIMGQIDGLPHIQRATADSARAFFAELKHKGHIDEVPEGFFQAMFRKSVQSYLLSWIKHDPAKEIAGVKVPTLIIQGTADLQVDTVQAHMLATAKPNARLLIIPDMNHVFKEVTPANPEINSATYYDPLLPIKTELVQGMVAFIKKPKGKS
jgi:alpha-beta hydrolase superfamily lysophospholipase